MTRPTPAIVVRFTLILLVVLTAIPSQALTYVVTLTSDGIHPGCSGDGCSLRDAILSANDNPGIDTIQLLDATYTLDVAGATEDLGLTGDLDVLDTDGLIIEGPGGGEASIIGGIGFGDRLFHIHAGSMVFRNLTLRNGEAPGGDGGGILVESSENLSLEQSTMTGCRAAANGGAIASNAILTLTDSMFLSNEANPLGSPNLGLGGAILLTDAIFGMTATNCLFADNRATGSGEPGGGYGGGLFLRGSLTDTSATPVTINECTFENNHADSHGGALFLGSIEDPSYSSLVMIQSTVRGNSAGTDGGGIAHGQLQTQEFGASSLIFLERNLFDRNTAGRDGGALKLGFESGARYRMFLRNSTLSANEAERNGGGIATDQILGSTLNIVINQCTFQANRADSDENASGLGGGIHLDQNTPIGAPAQIANSLIAKNLLGMTAGPSSDVHATNADDFASGGHNLVGNIDGGQWTPVVGDRLGTTGSLADPGTEDTLKKFPGGPELFMLTPASQAIDAGTTVANNIYPLGLSQDQRGRGRPVPMGGRYDIGAYEFDPADLPTPTPTPSNTPTITPTFTSTFTFTSTPTATLTPSRTDTHTPTETADHTDTPTPTHSPTEGATATSTPTETGTQTTTASPSPTQTAGLPCDLVEGQPPAPNPRCDAYDLLAFLADRRGISDHPTDFNGDMIENGSDLFEFALHWYLP